MTRFTEIRGNARAARGTGQRLRAMRQHMREWEAGAPVRTARELAGLVQDQREHSQAGRLPRETGKASGLRLVRDPGGLAVAAPEPDAPFDSAFAPRRDCPECSGGLSLPTAADREATS
jgi:ATP phosphoribosyltransferase regulatory subunit HisZ